MASLAPLMPKRKEDAEPSPSVSTSTGAPIRIARSTDPARSTILCNITAQAKGAISSPDDAAEREADRVAAHVVSMPEPSAKAAARAPASVMRSPLIVQRRAAPARRAPRQAASGGNVMQQVKAAANGGFALSRKTRAYLEPRFKADFSNVRLHTDAKAKELSDKVGARAFTFGRHIFFNEGQYNPDSKAGLELLAHELTHTIQQRETIQRKAIVHERTDPHVQRVGNPFAAVADAVGGAIDAATEFVGDFLQVVKDFAAEHADVLPGFKILCLVLGYNPVNDAPAPGGGRAILKELSTFIPFGDKVFEALNNHGIIDKGGAFIDTQIANFKALANAIIGAISSFFGSLGPSDALNPLGAWNRLKSSFTPVIASMKTFASGLINGFIDLVREVILPPMARWAAANIPHWDLLMGVLGVNPVSNGGESPTMQLIGAFMKLIGQEEVWENIKKGNAIGRAWAWFQTAMSGAKAMVSGIPGQVMATIRSFTIMDVLTVVGAVGKIFGLFASIGGQFMSWAGGTVIELLKIVIDVVAPGVMVYIQRAAGAFQTIVRNPIGFVGNLVRAAMQGFRQFAANFLTHLQASLVGWLTGAMGGTGVYIPRGMNLREILKFVLSVLGLTWANIRQKLVRATNETTVVALETGMDIVRTLVTEGPAAAWQKILETLTNLKQMAIDAIMDFVKQRVVQAAVTRLLSMLSPAGAFIQAVIAIYNTIMFFVERLRQIAQVAASFIDAIATIASGNIGPAANRVETTMAGLLTLVISFLARIAGLGRVADAITGLIARVRAPISTAIDRVVAWIVAQARRLGRFILQAGVPADPNARLTQGLAAATAAVNAMSGSRVTIPLMNPVLAIIRGRFGFQSLVPVQQDGVWWVEGHINPRSRARTRKQATVAGLTPQQLGTLIEPILARVEGQWMNERLATSSQATQAATWRAVGDVNAGGTAGAAPGRVVMSPMVSREHEIALMRGIDSGVVVVGAHTGTMRAEIALTGGEAGRGSTFVNEVGNMGRNFVGGAGTYDGSIPRHVTTVMDRIRRARGGAIASSVGVAVGATPTASQQRSIDAILNREALAEMSATRQRLTRVVEPGRSPGMLVGRRVGEVLAQSGQASVGEIAHGGLAPMAFTGASGRDMNTPENQQQRHTRLGAVIQRLRDSAQRATILAEPNGPELRRIGDSIENWLRANSRDMQNPDPRRMEAATRRLVDAFMAFLRSLQGGR